MSIMYTVEDQSGCRQTFVIVISRYDMSKKDIMSCSFVIGR